MTIKTRRTFFCLFFVVFSAVSCGGLVGKKPVYPSDVNDAMKRSFANAESHYTGGRYTSALELYGRYIRDFPYNRLTDEAYYKIGKIYFVQQKWDLSVSELTTLAGKSPDPEYRAKALLLASNALTKSGDNERAIATLKRAKADDLPTKLQIQFYSLLVRVNEKLSRPRHESDFAFLRMMDVFRESADPALSGLTAPDLFTMTEVTQRFQSWMISPIPVDNIPPWFRDYPAGYSRGYIEYKLGKIYFEAEMKDKAGRQLSWFLKSYPKHEYADSAQKMLNSLGVKEVAEGRGGEIKIGVLLPLSGPQQGYGEETLKGIKCGALQYDRCAAAFSDLFGKGNTVELVTLDSGTLEEEVMKKVETLAAQEVSAIVGPMSGNLAMAAAKKAHQMGVPIFPITQKKDLMTIGSYVFQMGYEADQQIADLASRAISGGRQSFGIFYPDNSYGKEMANLFATEVESKGGKIVSRAAYQPTATDLAAEARQLKLSTSRYSYEGKSAGFEALFIPDSFVTMNRIIPILEFVSIRDIPLLGTGAWNDPKLATDLFAGFPGSFYIDLFSLSDNNPMTANFVSAYRQSVGRDPTTIVALGFDAVLFIRQAAASANSNKPSKIRDALLDLGNLRGSTRIRGFSEDNGPNIDPIFHTVEGKPSSPGE